MEACPSEIAKHTACCLFLPISKKEAPIPRYLPDNFFGGHARPDAIIGKCSPSQAQQVAQRIWRRAVVSAREMPDIHAINLRNTLRQRFDPQGGSAGLSRA